MATEEELLRAYSQSVPLKKIVLDLGKGYAQFRLWLDGKKRFVPTRLAGGVPAVSPEDAGAIIRLAMQEGFGMPRRDSQIEKPATAEDNPEPGTLAYRMKHPRWYYAEKPRLVKATPSSGTSGDMMPL